MFNRKRKLSELQATALVTNTLLKSSSEKIKIMETELKKIYPDTFVLEDPFFAPIDLALAEIAIEFQAVDNLLEAEVASRIKVHLRELLNTDEYGEYNIALYELFDRKFKEDILKEGDGIGAISAAFLQKILGNGIKKFLLQDQIIDPMLIMSTSVVLVNGSGLWKDILTEYGLTKD